MAKKCDLKLIIFGLGLSAYLMFGATIFMVLESDAGGGSIRSEHLLEDHLNDTVARLLGDCTCVNGAEGRKEMISAAVTAIIDIVNSAPNPLPWDYSNSFFFAGTVVTTIGYGHLAPSTRAGRAFCILYAFVGIPLCGLFLKVVGNKLGSNARRLEERLKKCGCLAEYPKTTRLLYLLILIVFGIVVFIAFPSLIISEVEGWSFLESWYHCLITLLTIGFGDFVMGSNKDIEYHIAYKIAGYFWIAIGLAYIALLIDDIADIIAKWNEKMETEADVLGDHLGLPKMQQSGIDNTGVETSDKLIADADPRDGDQTADREANTTSNQQPGEQQGNRNSDDVQNPRDDAKLPTADVI